jgi:hypothetical protein
MAPPQKTAWRRLPKWRPNTFTANDYKARPDSASAAVVPSVKRSEPQQPRHAA